MKYQHETIHEGNPRFGEVRALFEGPQGWTHVGGGANE
jgi:hypothetical protein